ncbi:MFS transporter [Catelliglobosispora koreensis]|uniref:MFS transporter n=1 Tax=Catelliglobosispora koreensis TaxID=129052 RepID=UPI00035E83E4|nr:MFS transporter [Catelliglobosispora koreensis]
MGNLRTNKTFRLLVLARAVNVLGNAIAPIALAFALLDMGFSASELGLVVGARTLANVIFLLAGGVLADRVPRSLVLIGSMTTAFLSQATVAALVLSGNATLTLLMILSLVNGMASAFAMPAAAALIGEVVPTEDRRNANAVNGFARNGAMIIGAGFGGILVATLGPGLGLAVDAATFAVAGLIYLRVPVKPAPPKQSHVFADLRIGWRELTNHTWLWAVVLGFCFINMVYGGVYQVLGPVIADASFGREVWGLIIAANTVGMVGSAVLAMRIKVKHPLRLGVICVLGEPLMMVALAKTSSPALLIAVSLLAGVGLQQFVVAWETSMQNHVDADKLARVYSWDMLGSFVAIPVGTALAGPVSLKLGMTTTLIGGAAICTVALALVLASRSVRTLPGVKPTSQPDPYPLGV